MRRGQKKKVIDLMLTIHNALPQFYQLVKNGQLNTALEILADIQDGAVTIGTVIEQSEGADHKIVGELETYCELLYEASVILQESQVVDDVYGKLLRKAEIILEQINKEIPEQFEAAFLPYKASMWDSLESVWMAAEKDPQCNAYVVPIPYFDRKGDGSFGTMHYEGSLYPSYVPITDWKEYELEKRHPDVIYIHNPYDGCNRVTSVHPYFYAEKIKDYTDMLVYIPYFVSVFENDENFCDTPGIFFADRVVLDSQAVRDTYVRVLQKFEAEHNGRGMFGDLKKKFLACGSPKYDKVINTKREEVSVPPEWLNIILREDGTKKKVVLYNTTITTLLQHNEKALNKIKDALSVFRNNPDVALLWRPHPLNGATMESMRPQLLAEYCSIVSKYQEEGWGIFDDTPELNRAIALSDAYYGNWSSVVALFRATGKPIMIDNLELVKGQD